MNKKYLPSLIIAAKGMMIIGIGILFKFTEKPGGSFLLAIGGGIIFIALIVLIIMSSIKPKQ